MSEPSFVYWITPVDAGIAKVKIGLTRTPAKRFSQISCMSPVPLQISGLALGERKHEQQLHKQLHRFRLYGEWFEAHPDVLRTIVPPPLSLEHIASWMAEQTQRFPHYNLQAILRELHHLTPPRGTHGPSTAETSPPRH